MVAIWLMFVLSGRETGWPSRCHDMMERRKLWRGMLHARDTSVPGDPIAENFFSESEDKEEEDSILVMGDLAS